MNTEPSREEMLNFIQTEFDQALERFHHSTVNPNTIASVKSHAISVLKKRIESGDLPSSPDLTRGLDVKQDIDDPSRVIIKFPVKFSLYLEHGVWAFMPRYGSQHCSSCIFLAHYESADLYFCPQVGLVPTVLARMSKEPSDYQSGISIATSAEASHPLAIAFRIAQDEGLIGRSV